MTQEEDEKMQLEYIEAYFDNRTLRLREALQANQIFPSQRRQQRLLTTCQICTTSAKDC